VLEEWERQIHSYGELILSELRRGAGTGEIMEMLFESLTSDPKTRQFSEQSLRGMLMSTVVGYYQYYQRTGEIG